MNDEPLAQQPPKRRRRGQPLNEPKEVIQVRFLKAFAELGIVKSAANKVGIDRTTVYHWLKEYPDFAERYQEAEQDANDVIREEIRRRAIDGWDEPVVSAGKLVTTVRKYSDTLITLLAKSRMPEYREKTQIDGNLTIGAYRLEEITNNPEITELSNELLKRIAGPTGDPSGFGVSSDAPNS